MTLTNCQYLCGTIKTLVKNICILQIGQTKRVLFPADIIQEDSNLIALTDIQTYFDLSINFLDYYRVRLNLEKFIKHTNIENFQIQKPFLPYYLKFVCGNAKSNKFYRIINQNYDNNTLRSKWSIKKYQK